MKGTLAVTGDAAADKLLSKDPLALLIGMVLDQQVPLEKAFRGPLDLLPRLGVKKLDARELALWDADAFVQAFVTPPAIHRYPAAMAKRVQDLCRVLVDEYGGKADKVWKDAASGAELYRRIKALPGFGDQKARIFVALLAKQLNVQPAGWETVTKEYGEPGSYRSVADIVDESSLQKVRAFKTEMKKAAKAAKSP